MQEIDSSSWQLPCTESSSFAGLTGRDPSLLPLTPLLDWASSSSSLPTPIGSGDRFEWCLGLRGLLLIPFWLLLWLLRWQFLLGVPLRLEDSSLEVSNSLSSLSETASTSISSAGSNSSSDLMLVSDNFPVEERKIEHYSHVKITHVYSTSNCL